MSWIKHKSEPRREMTSMPCSDISHPNQRKENDELRRHVKRRTQALDTIRRSYIIDVERLKRGLRDQVNPRACGYQFSPEARFAPAAEQICCVPETARRGWSTRKSTSNQTAAHGADTRKLVIVLLFHRLCVTCQPASIAVKGVSEKDAHR